MFKYGCPAARANRAAHQKFLEFLKNTEKSRRSAASTLIWMKEMHTFLEEWLSGHICQIDAQLRSSVDNEVD